MTEKKLSKEAIDLIEAPNFAHIATINKNGSIQITPVWIDHEGDKYVLVNTTFGRAKTRNLEKNPEVGLSLVDQKNPYHGVSISGKVVEVTATGADEHIDKMANKYLGKEKYPWKSPEEKRALVKIAPRWIYVH